MKLCECLAKENLTEQEANFVFVKFLIFTCALYVYNTECISPEAYKFLSKKIKKHWNIITNHFKAKVSYEALDFPEHGSCMAEIPAPIKMITRKQLARLNDNKQATNVIYV